MSTYEVKFKRDVTYPIGTRVRIRTWPKRPDNWNEEMYRDMTGTYGTICHVLPGGDRDYRYSLSDNPWAWRHIDLIPVKMAEPEPNLAFRMKKYGNR